MRHPRNIKSGKVKHVKSKKWNPIGRSKGNFLTSGPMKKEEGSPGGKGFFGPSAVQGPYAP